ncbi:MAG TPA: tetratricopeptide repeat protein, partial [Casimicrobiaceae bacterium]|nr:tetratricopeptide repeat protein [Casimicrobiaceae bacterium]
MTDGDALTQARRALQSGNAREAEDLARRVLAEDGGNVDAAQVVAVCLLRRAAFAEALPLLEALVQAQPASAGARSNLA